MAERADRALARLQLRGERGVLRARAVALEERRVQRGGSRGRDSARLRRLLGFARRERLRLGKRRLEFFQRLRLRRGFRRQAFRVSLRLGARLRERRLVRQPTRLRLREALAQRRLHLLGGGRVRLGGAPEEKLFVRQARLGVARGGARRLEVQTQHLDAALARLAVLALFRLERVHPGASRLELALEVEHRLARAILLERPERTLGGELAFQIAAGDVPGFLARLDGAGARLGFRRERLGVGAEALQVLGVRPLHLELFLQVKEPRLQRRRRGLVLARGRGFRARSRRDSPRLALAA